MMDKKSIKSTLRNIGPYVIASGLSLLFVFIFLKLYRADWRIQFFYGGDAMFYDMLIKGVIENGWILNNKSLGMPYGATLYDFPIPDTFSLLLIKLAALFTSNDALILNLFYISTYPLTAITSLYVLRQFNISFYPALLGSMLYTFLPYHLLRSEIHLFYATYYVVPLMVLVILWVCAAGDKGDHEGDRQLRLSLRNPKFIFSLVVCILIASTGGVYYSFFGCYLLLIAGIAQAIAFKQIRRLLMPAVLTAVIFAAMLANLAPSVIYQFKNGKTDTAQRVAEESEFFGLKVAQLMLPITGHRIKKWRRAKDKYNRAPLVNENDTVSLGLIGTVGFVILLGSLVSNRYKVEGGEAESTRSVIGQLSVLNISAVLLGTIGGFSALFALLVSAQIRAYNRIVVYIAFFALLTVALLLERARQRFFQTRGLKAAFGVLAILLTILGLLDQTGRHMVPDYASVKKIFENDSDFVRRIEASMPEGAMIFQLPVKRFPETPPIERVFDYDLLKGYIHSRELRWSYGAIRSREGDIWQASVASAPIPEMVETVALADFAGIYIDRFGYPDNAAKLESELATLLDTEPLVSNDQRLSFFNLYAFQQRLRDKYPAKEMAIKREQAIYPVLANWASGFSNLEKGPEDEWRWCGPSGELVLNNPAPYPRRVTVEMAFTTHTEGNMRIESQFFTEQLKTSLEPMPFSKTFDVPPGKYKLKFASDAPKVYVPNDPRTMVFRLINFKLKSS